MRYGCAALTGLLLLYGPVLAAEPNRYATYDRDSVMTGYTDQQSGITLKISEDRLRITAFDKNGKQLWSRADYAELSLVLPGQSPEPARPARIAYFRPLQTGKAGQVERDYAHRQGLRGPILTVIYSAACCGGAQGYISETDGKLLHGGTN